MEELEKSRIKAANTMQERGGGQIDTWPEKGLERVPGAALVAQGMHCRASQRNPQKQAGSSHGTKQDVVSMMGLCRHGTSAWWAHKQDLLGTTLHLLLALL